MWWSARACGLRRAFTVLEVIVALTILGIGMLGIIRLFPMGLEASMRASDQTRAAILAQQILEGLKSDAQGLPFVQGEIARFGIPGNGVDDNVLSGVLQFPDRNNNGKPDMDFDGGYVDRFTGADCQSGPDGLPDVWQCSAGPPLIYDNLIGVGARLWYGDANGDGDPYYDPENSPGFGVDEGYPADRDGDGRIDLDSDEDNMLATNFRGGSRSQPDPLAPGDGLDNDGDGEEGSPTVRVLLFDYPPNPDNPPTSARWVELKVADGIDNNGDGRIDEGIDEEIFDFQDNDGDGLVDEDCRLAAYPFTPRPFQSPVLLPDDYPEERRGRFAHPNERFSWQVLVGRVSDGGGDGRDNDGDGYIDEDPLDGMDNDRDGRIDEDPSAMPLPGYRKVVVRITWGGDGEDNDQDGRIDEELRNGLDDDFDGLIDEDTYRYFYELTGYIQLGV